MSDLDYAGFDRRDTDSARCDECDHALDNDGECPACDAALTEPPEPAFPAMDAIEREVFAMRARLTVAMFEAAELGADDAADALREMRDSLRDAEKTMANFRRFYPRAAA